MTSLPFTYDKPKVLQALRFHFLTRPEIKILVILVNIFAIVSVTLFFMKQIQALPFLVSSLLWFVLMILFWFVLPRVIYKQNATFKDSFSAVLGREQFAIENSRGHRGWDWTTFSHYVESPYFYHLYFNAQSFFLLPKEAFEGDEVHEARKILTAKIKLQR